MPAIGFENHEDIVLFEEMFVEYESDMLEDAADRVAYEAGLER